ncbi:pseudouridine synthase [Flagelloscypha sp. PMI_526]|nr:pseudouridine synthase [Flagelloscypha sp. PMI_526]
MLCCLKHSLPRFQKSFHTLTTAASTTALLYVDKGYLICNKPPGLVVQPNQGEYDLGHLYQEIQQQLEATKQQTFYPVHRLDKPTTGCYVLARTPHMAREMSRQMKARHVEKEYLALVSSKTLKTSMAGVIDHPIGQDEEGRVRLDSHGKQSLTQWKVISSNSESGISLVIFRPKTGLKHQIRVHTASVLKAPIIGEFLYPSPSRHPERFLYLHSFRFSFFRYFGRSRHIITVAAPIPPYFEDYCDQLGLPLPPSAVTGGLWLNRIPAHNIPEIGGRWII